MAGSGVSAQSCGATSGMKPTNFTICTDLNAPNVYLPAGKASLDSDMLTFLKQSVFNKMVPQNQACLELLAGAVCGLNAAACQASGKAILPCFSLCTALAQADCGFAPDLGDGSAQTYCQGLAGNASSAKFALPTETACLGPRTYTKYAVGVRGDGSLKSDPPVSSARTVYNTTLGDSANTSDTGNALSSLFSDGERTT